VGAASVNVQAGSSVSVSVSLSPASDEQTQGCGMAECPQTCPPECTDANGQCTCAGQAYSTYHTSVAVTSSNGGVATASYAGGAVQIYGVGAGSATVTLTASLRQFSSSSATIAVVVSEPTNDAEGGSGATSPIVGTGAPTGSGDNAAADANSVVASPTELSRAVSDAAARDEGVTEDTVIEMHGTSARLTRLGAGAQTVAKLREVAGTEGQITFWHGASVEHPDYSWTFYGRDLDVSALDGFDEIDLGLTVTEKGSGLVAALLDGADKTLVLDFAFDGALPAPATLYIASPASMSPSDALSLYRYDGQAKSFRHVLDGLYVESGYIAFETDHCSIWAISAQDLAVIPAAQAPTAAPDASGGYGFLSLSAGMPLVLLLVAAVAVAVLAASLVVFGRRHRR
jgi:hypothetical protein